jgi:hypothetical protein
MIAAFNFIFLIVTASILLSHIHSFWFGSFRASGAFALLSMFVQLFIMIINASYQGIFVISSLSPPSTWEYHVNQEETYINQQQQQQQQSYTNNNGLNEQQQGQQTQQHGGYQTA